MAKNKLLSNPNKVKDVIKRNSNKDLSISNLINKMDAVVINLNDGNAQATMTQQETVQDDRFEEELNKTLYNYFSKGKRWGDFCNYVLGFSPQHFLDEGEYTDLQTLIQYSELPPGNEYKYSMGMAVSKAYAEGWCRNYATALLVLANHPVKIWSINEEIKAIKLIFNIDINNIEVRKHGQIKTMYHLTWEYWTKQALASWPNEFDPLGLAEYTTHKARSREEYWRKLDESRDPIEDLNNTIKSLLMK